jgi:hypothetical protein
MWMRRSPVSERPVLREAWARAGVVLTAVAAVGLALALMVVVVRSRLGGR